MLMGIGTLFLGIAALGTMLLTQRNVARRIGKPNGKGNVVEMNERILMEIGGVKAVQAEHTSLLEAHTERLSKLEHATVEVHTDRSGQHVTVSTPSA